MEYSEILKYNPYDVSKEEKEKILSERINFLTKYHYDNCDKYKNILDFLGYNSNTNYSLNDSFFIPIRLFKELELLSVDKSQIVRTMTSSGTTGQRVSKIFLDKETSINQQKTLNNIMKDFIPKTRLPMIIIDTERVIKDKNFFSARKAGILGFSLFAKDKIYALDYNMNLNIELIKDFLKKNKDKTILAFGYTYIIYEYFYNILKSKNINLDMKNVVLLHGGGWKKLVNLNISNLEFNRIINEITKIPSISDYYGMVEQTGSIYMTCKYGYMHASTYSDIIIRNPEDFSICNFNEKGIIQLVSSIPTSYPGHNILTEDEGIILGEDNCKCSRKGKYFKILGRLKNAEVRGCSDTFEK